MNAIQRIFTGSGEKFLPGDEPNSKIKSWEFRNLQTLMIAIKELERKKIASIFFLLTSNSKKLKKYKELVPLYIESEMICEKMTIENNDFYYKLIPSPRCLNCNGSNVSTVSFDKDTHFCGGHFIFLRTYQSSDTEKDQRLLLMHLMVLQSKKSDINIKITKRIQNLSF